MELSEADIKRCISDLKNYVASGNYIEAIRTAEIFRDLTLTTEQYQEVNALLEQIKLDNTGRGI
jgi:translation initiation factor 2B subunit (eIF-2B alpha/beta/delta family)